MCPLQLNLETMLFIACLSAQICSSCYLHSALSTRVGSLIIHFFIKFFMLQPCWWLLTSAYLRYLHIKWPCSSLKDLQAILSDVKDSNLAKRKGKKKKKLEVNCKYEAEGWMYTGIQYESPAILLYQSAPNLQWRIHRRLFKGIFQVSFFHQYF